MAVRLDALEHVFNLSLRANEKGRSCHTHDLLAIHVLLFDHVKLVRDLFVGIGKKRIRQLFFFFKLLLGGRFVGRDAEDNQAGLLQLCVCIAEPASLDGSAWSICPGIEEQHHCLTPELF